MITFSEHESAFMNATLFYVEKNWHRQKGLFAEKAGISGGYLSEIIGRRKCPKLDKQERIAKILGYKTLYDFIDFGKSLTPTDLASVISAMQMDGVKKDTNKAPTPNIEDHTNICNIQDEAAKRHHIIIEDFEDREWAIAVNQILVQIEQRGSPEMKELAKGSLENILKILPDTKKGLLNGTKDVK